ncbi:MAG TPA: hypothetical protein VMI47_06325 [Pseudolabrys sp.]|nr:hypothetical protein [Pseudolabrys sp.]
MKTETEFDKRRLIDLAGMFVLFAMGISGLSMLIAWFYVYW